MKDIADFIVGWLIVLIFVTVLVAAVCTARSSDAPSPDDGAEPDCNPPFSLSC